MHQFKIPQINVMLGFDMQEGDWMPPHGKGKNLDFF